MSLSRSDVERIAQLARIELDPASLQATQAQLNGIFDLIEQLKSVDTSAVLPLATPLAAAGAVELRLRADEVSESDRRSDFQKPAPSTADGLYLVPRVIE